MTRKVDIVLPHALLQTLRRKSCFILLIGSVHLLAACGLKANEQLRMDGIASNSQMRLCVTADCWSDSINLGPPVNTSSDDRHTSLTFDDLRMYFVSNRSGGYGGEDIWVAARDSISDPWQEPKNLGNVINTEFQERSPLLSLDGHWLYFATDRPGGCGRYDLWVSERNDVSNDFDWSEPVNLGCDVNSPDSDFGPAIYYDSIRGRTELYFASTRLGGPGGGDIYVAFKGDDKMGFGKAVLVPELSSEFNEYAPEVNRVNGLEMYFETDRPGGVGGLDVWVSVRDSVSDRWTEPVNLGPRINSPADDSGPSLSLDNTQLFFDSRREGGYGGWDVYVTTRANPL